MILFGVNFNLYFFLLLGDFKQVYKNEELKTYFGIIVAATLMITMNISHMYESVWTSLRHAAFQVGTIITTTGYATADFNLWPEFSKCILLTIMMIGACASSTGGGIKVSRLLIIIKSIYRVIQQMLHPKSVNVVRVNGKKLSDSTIMNVYVYIVAYVVLIVSSVLIVSLDNFDFATTFSSVIATVNNIGPGIGAVGPTGSFADFSPLSKIVFCFDMLAGRLEIFPFLMLFSFVWRKKF